MPRVARKTFKGEKLFHVMVQGINKEKIFFYEREKLEYLKLLKKYIEEYKLKIISYCIMDNHIHILIDVENVNNLTNFMQKVNTSYAIYYNKNRNRVGYVYRDRYKIQVIQNKKHLYNCIVYIHNNPVKAGICSFASQYKYSSYKNFMSNDNIDLLNEMFINIDEYKKAHQVFCTTDMSFLEDEEGKDIDIKNEIDNYLSIKRSNIKDLKYNDELLIPIVIKLNKIYKLSIRKISEYLNVGREKVRNIIIKN